MHLIADQSVLLPELALVASAAPASSSIRSLSQVRIEACDSGAVKLTASNLEFGLSSEIPAQVAEPGVICLPTKQLLVLVSALDGEITIRTSANYYATITAGSSRSRMPGDSADTFGELEPMPEGAVGIDAETLALNLSRVKPFVAPVTGRFEVAAALVALIGDRLTFVATDGRRLALVRVAMESAPFRFLFPLGAMGCVPRLLEGQERACLAATKEHLFVEAGSRLLVARQIAGSFPDYQRVLPEFDVPPAIIDSEALRTAMTRVSLFTETGARTDPKMCFTFRAGELAISAESVQGGEGEDALPVEYSGPEIAVVFNPRFVLQFLDVVPEAKLRVWVKPGCAATEWRPEGDDDYRYVLMAQWGKG